MAGVNGTTIPVFYEFCMLLRKRLIDEAANTIKKSKRLPVVPILLNTTLNPPSVNLREVTLNSANIR